jgi:photosystem II stability/assembly factor-like uncharacterized protein
MALLLLPVLLLAVCNVSQAANGKIEFSMLPAVHIQNPEKAVLLDIIQLRQRIVAVGEYGLIIFSDDQGKNWQQASVPVSVSLTSVFFVNDTSGWATGHQGVILHTRNGGKNWEKQLDGKQATQNIITTGSALLSRWRQQQENDELPEGSDEDAFAMQIEDLEYLLEDKNKSLQEGPSEPLFDIWFADKNTGYAVGAYGFIFKTDDGGQNWTIDSSYFNNVDKFHFYQLTALNKQTLFLTGESGTIWRTNDGAEHWTKLSSPYDGSFFGGLKTADNHLLVYGLRGHAFISKSLGDTWHKLELPSSSTILGASSFGDASLALTGSDGTVILSDNNGKDFQLVELKQRSSYSAIIRLPGTDNTREKFAVVGKNGLNIITAPEQSH